jgi:hypothetical protein
VRLHGKLHAAVGRHGQEGPQPPGFLVEIGAPPGGRDGDHRHFQGLRQVADGGELALLFGGRADSDAHVEGGDALHLVLGDQPRDPRRLPLHRLPAPAGQRGGVEMRPAFVDRQVGLPEVESRDPGDGLFQRPVRPAQGGDDDVVRHG